MTQPSASDADQQRAPARTDEDGAPATPRANGFLLAVQFLTIAPVRLRVVSTRESTRDAGQPDMGRALPWFPLVGALLGVGVVALNWALEPVFARGLRDVIALGAPLLATGMLHFDGFVDCCDALLGSRTVARRLEILRDSRVGAYGVGGGALLLLARYAALEALPTALWALALIAALIVGRWAIVWVMTLFPYARAHGAGSGFRSGPRRLALASAVAVALLGALAALTPWGTLLRRGLLLVGLGVAGLGVALLWALWASRRLGGGLTGDTYGASDELVELAVLALAGVVAQIVLFIV
jgi:adenosylcobinamide-GDP ribazoletransferase